MNYGQMRDYTLQLINQYTIAGKTYEESYNNQADYIARIPFLINDALSYIATSVRPFYASLELDPECAEDYGRWNRYALPSDFYHIRNGSLMTAGGEQFRDYKIIEPDFILVGKDLKEAAIMEYERYPRQLPASPSDSAAVEGTVPVQTAACFYAASHLLTEDDAYNSARLYNEFEDKMSRLAPRPFVEPTVTEDVYGF